jgi:hypothetical protein
MKPVRYETFACEEALNPGKPMMLIELKCKGEGPRSCGARENPWNLGEVNTN